MQRRTEGKKNWKVKTYFCASKNIEMATVSSSVHESKNMFQFESSFESSFLKILFCEMSKIYIQMIVQTEKAAKVIASKMWSVVAGCQQIKKKQKGLHCRCMFT